MSQYQPAQAPPIDELIERCLAGDQQAWEQIVRLHWRKVFNVAYKFVGKHDEAEDLAQDIFPNLQVVSTFDRRANFQRGSSAQPNLCIDHRIVPISAKQYARDVDPGDLSRCPSVSPSRAEARDRVSSSAGDDVAARHLRTAVLLRDIKEGRS